MSWPSCLTSQTFIIQWENETQGCNVSWFWGTIHNVFCALHRSAIYMEYKPCGTELNWESNDIIYGKYLAQCLAQGRCSKNLSLETGEKLVKLLKVEMRSWEKYRWCFLTWGKIIICERIIKAYFLTCYKNFIFCQVVWKVVQWYFYFICLTTEYKNFYSWK